MLENKTIYFYSTKYCHFCNVFKKIIKMLNYEKNFKEIDINKIYFSNDIIVDETTQIYTPIFFYIENGKKILINNDLLFKKITNNYELLKNDKFKENFTENKNNNSI